MLSVNGIMFVFISYTILLKASLLKGGAFYCYCAYVLRISTYSRFPIGDAFNTVVFLDGLRLSVESRSL